MRQPLVHQFSHDVGLQCIVAALVGVAPSLLGQSFFDTRKVQGVDDAHQGLSPDVATTTSSIWRADCKLSPMETCTAQKSSR